MGVAVLLSGSCDIYSRFFRCMYVMPFFHRFKMFTVIQRDRACILLHIGETKDKEIKKFDWQQKKKTYWYSRQNTDLFSSTPAQFFLQISFFKPYYFGMIVESQEVIKKIKESFPYSSPSFPTDNILHNIIATRNLTLVQSTQLTQISPVLHKLMCTSYVYRSMQFCHMYRFI